MGYAIEKVISDALGDWAAPSIILWPSTSLLPTPKGNGVISFSCCSMQRYTSRTSTFLSCQSLKVWRRLPPLQHSKLRIFYTLYQREIMNAIPISRLPGSYRKPPYPPHPTLQLPSLDSISFPREYGLRVRFIPITTFDSYIWWFRSNKQMCIQRCRNYTGNIVWRNVYRHRI